MTSNSPRKRSEEVVGAGLPECICSRRRVGCVLRAWSCLCSHDVEGILGVSGKKEAAEKRAVNRLQPLPKHQGPGSEGAASGNSLLRPMPLQQSEKGNENLSIGKPSRESRFKACSFILPSLISCQIFPCILHFSGDSKLYFYIKSKGKVFGHWNVALHC